MDKLQQFFEQFPRMSFKKRATIFYPGDIPRGVYYIEKGYARLYTLSGDGKELSLLIYKEGDCFPVVWTFTGRPSAYYFETLTPVVARQAPREAFLNFINSHGDEFLKLTVSIILRFESGIHRMEHLALGRAYTKVSSVIFILGQDIGEKKGSEIIIPIPLTHKDIATFVGMTREATSLEMEKLEKEGLIGKKDHLIVIKDMERLKDVSSLSRE